MKKIIYKLIEIMFDIPFLINLITSIGLLIVFGIGVFKLGINILFFLPIILAIILTAIDSIYHFLVTYLKLSDIVSFNFIKYVSIAENFVYYFFFYFYGCFFIYMTTIGDENKSFNTFIYILIGIIFIFITLDMIKKIKNINKKYKKMKR